jgi:hypothetical protein
VNSGSPDSVGRAIRQRPYSRRFVGPNPAALPVDSPR